jgi:hypothetical protein
MQTIQDRMTDQMTFEQFCSIVQAQVTQLTGSYPTLYVTDVDKDQLYATYLGSFPPGTNSIHIERTSHDCSACKQFIRSFGAVVAIVDNELVSVWDLTGLDVTYGTVAAAMSAYVKSAPIANQFKYEQAKIGIPGNVSQLADLSVVTWHHLHADLPSRLVVSRGESVGAAVGEMRDRKNVFMRACNELTEARHRLEWKQNILRLGSYGNGTESDLGRRSGKYWGKRNL